MDQSPVFTDTCAVLIAYVPHAEESGRDDGDYYEYEDSLEVDGIPYVCTCPGDGGRNAEESVKGIDSGVKESELAAFLEKARLFCCIFFHKLILRYAISFIILSMPHSMIAWMSFLEGSTNSQVARSSGSTS